jgi:hypothetical protein
MTRCGSQTYVEEDYFDTRVEPNTDTYLQNMVKGC